VATVLVGAFVTGNNLYTLGLALTIGLGALSLVLLSGYGGQIWLCQFTFMGLGAWAMTKVDGGNSVLGVLAAVGLCAVAGGILALPALRLRALYMALATLAFAVLMDQLFFTNPSILPSGSMNVAVIGSSAFGSSSSSGTRSWLMRTRSANPPGSSRVARKRSQRVSWPRRQRRHSPQGVWWWIATLVPGSGFVTPGPTARTVPTTSCPSTAGRRDAMYQSVTSEPHTPQARTSQTTSPGPGSGSDASSIRTSPAANDRATLMW